jgi:hypothetical protein
VLFARRDRYDIVECPSISWADASNDPNRPTLSGGGTRVTEISILAVAPTDDRAGGLHCAQVPSARRDRHDISQHSSIANTMNLNGSGLVVGKHGIAELAK